MIDNLCLDIDIDVICLSIELLGQFLSVIKDILGVQIILKLVWVQLFFDHRFVCRDVAKYDRLVRNVLLYDLEIDDIFGAIFHDCLKDHIFVDGGDVETCKHDSRIIYDYKKYLMLMIGDRR
jgi:hypothetical protein